MILTNVGKKMIFSTGKPILHGTLTQYTNGLLLPTAISVCTCEAHTKNSDPVFNRCSGRCSCMEAAQQTSKMSQLTDIPPASLTYLQIRWRKQPGRRLDVNM